ncbi:hypothetical protein ACQYAD_06760 [Neobacillus sp. SM06]|uniref:hypothetical protein n=1 Tax=Neobacillus sp. SM06 TaxID=3422492 RepID=UPI003D27D399
MKTMSRLEAILWNIALPGFSQLLLGKYIKGILFVLLEFVINVNSQFNLAIIYSFLGEIERAESVVNYEWLMFYPCVYMFAMWDAYRIVMPPDERFSFLPFVFAAYFITVGLMYSSRFTLFKQNLGPVFLPMAFLPLGLAVGWIIKYFLIVKSSRE